MEDSMALPQKTKYRTTVWSSNPTPGHISDKTFTQKRYMHPYVYCSTIHNTQDMETTLMLLDEWIKMMWSIYIIEYYLTLKKNEIMPANCSHMDATRNSHTKWSTSERERQIPYDITYIWNLKYGTDEPIYKNRLKRHGGQTCHHQGGRGGSEMDWDFGVSTCKLLYLEWVNN